MIKVAIFVEGLTEKKFINELIARRYGHLPYQIKEIRFRTWEQYVPLQALKDSPSLTCGFLIVEVPSYDNLFSYVIDSAAGMVHKRGFNLLIGLRDLHPSKRSDKMVIVRMNDRILAGRPERDRIALILAVMETEAWFLCDAHVFDRIHSSLTPGYIQAKLNLDLVNDDPEIAYDAPSETLDSILRLVNLRYRKHEAEVDSVVNNIDYSYLCSCFTRVDSFFKFLDALDRSGLQSRI